MYYIRGRVVEGGKTNQSIVGVKGMKWVEWVVSKMVCIHSWGDFFKGIMWSLVRKLLSGG